MNNLKAYYPAAMMSLILIIMCDMLDLINNSDVIISNIIWIA